MNIQKEVLPNQTTLLTLTCPDGFFISLSSLGASIRQIGIPLSDGTFKNIALSFAEETAYSSNSLFAGATLAPCAGRISNGRLPLDSGQKILQLSRNENGCHNLHGGFHNASFQNWEVNSAEMAVFVLTLPDGLDGFPGNRTLKAIYTLTDEHELTLHYEAISDAETYFNLSNHCYFNLSGNFSASALDHLLQINADQVICNAPDFIPEGIAPVAGSPFDFRTPTAPAAQIKRDPGNVQLLRNQGYNHGFILRHPDGNNDPSMQAYEFHTQLPLSKTYPQFDRDISDLVCIAPDHSCQMSISSDAPCMVLYSGGYIEKGQALTNGQHTCPSCALAFEFQDYPDAPGEHGFPYRTTPAGELWQRTIRYRFQF